MKHITKVRELYEETIHWISKSEDSWKNFLSCMGRLYQLDFLNTCMVYAQRPDASVLAGYDAWHEMDLPVARGSKGIAVFPSKIFGEGVTHVYDIQDVKGQGIRPWNWQVNGTNRRLLARELFPEIYEQEKKFKNSLDAFTRTNVWLMIEEEDEILKSLQKLAVLTGEGQEVKENQITEFLVNSVCYAVESRCGIRDDTLDFSFICGFSENEEILYRTGRLVSHLSGRIVLQIARTMKNIDLERRQYYGRNRRNPVQGNEWRTDTSFRGRDERGEDAGVPEPLRQDRSTGNEENGPGPIRNDAPVREIDGETYENPDRSGGIPRETGRKSSEDLDQRGQDRPLQHVGNDQSSDTGGYGSTETGYGGDHSPQDRIKQKKTEEDTEKGTASAVPFPSGEIEPVQPENWQKEKILLEMTEREIPYKIYEFYRNNPEETDREAYLYEVYGDVKREAHTKDGILTAESCPSGFYILWSKETSMKEAFWYWDEVSFEIGKRIERGTYLPLLSVSEQALENGEDIEETLQPENTQEVFEEKKPFPLEEIGIAFYKQNIQADILKKMLCLVYTTNQLPEEKNHFLKMLLLREVPEGQPYYLVRTEHGNYELCIQESGIRITLPESQDFLQELSWDQFGGLTAHLAEDDQIAYTEDAETLEQQARNVQAAQIQRVNSMIVGLAQYLQPSICSHALHVIDRRINNTALAVWKKRFPRHYNKYQIPMEKLCNLPHRHEGYKSKTFAVPIEGEWFGITMAFITHSKYESKPFDQRMTPYTEEGRRIYSYFRSRSKPLPCDRPSVNTARDIQLSVYAKTVYNFEYFMNREYAYNRDKGKCKCCKKPLFLDNKKYCYHVKGELPLGKVNKVQNLVWLCNDCYRMVNNGPIPPNIDEKVLKKMYVSSW